MIQEIIGAIIIAIVVIANKLMRSYKRNSRLYKKVKGKMLCSEDDGETWFDLFKHLKEEHGIDLDKQGRKK